LIGPNKRQKTIETWLAALEARLPKPAPEPIAPEVAAAFHDSALAVHKRTGSTRLAKRAGLLWATAVAADLAAGRPARPRFSIGGEPTAEGREALDRLLTEIGWDPAGPPRPEAPDRRIRSGDRGRIPRSAARPGTLMTTPAS
jgi:hypothetical protein